MTATLYTSKKTSIEIAIYPHASDTVLLRTQGTGPDTPSLFPEGKAPRITSFAYSKTLGGTAATWMCQMKVVRSQRATFEDAFQDDDWVDVSLLRAGKRYHLLRGLVRTTRRLRTVEEGGVTTVTYELTGSDHQAVFDLTRVWFNNWSDENLFGGAALRAAGYAGDFYGSPPGTVSSMLFGFMRVLSGFGRNLWKLPPGLPGIATGAAFPEAVLFLADDSANTPARRAVGAHAIAPEGQSVWDLAAEWCDPHVNELFCDLVTFDSRPIGPDDVLGPDGTQMAVVIRQRPFPTDEDVGGASNSAWGKLGTVRVPRQLIITDDLARRGEDRLNVFEAPTLILQEGIGVAANLYAPLIDTDDVKIHGVRPLSIHSRYVCDVDQGVSDADMAEINRRKLRDWYCLQHLLWSGEISFATALPELRVGMRLEVGEIVEELETFYVEAVSHRWTLTSGVVTTATVTRGWRGGDSSFLSALGQRSVGYRLLNHANPGDVLPPVSNLA